MVFYYSPHGGDIMGFPIEPQEEGAIWRSIGVYLGGYEVSNMGGVCKASNRRGKTLRLTHCGYVEVGLQIRPNENKTFPVHRLVCYTFKPESLPATITKSAISTRSLMTIVYPILNGSQDQRTLAML